MSMFKNRMLERALALIMSVVLLISIIPTTINVHAESTQYVDYILNIVTEVAQEEGEDTVTEPLEGVELTIVYYSDPDGNKEIGRAEGIVTEGACTLRVGVTNGTTTAYYAKGASGKNEWIMSNRPVYYRLEAAEKEDYQPLTEADRAIVEIANSSADVQRDIIVYEKLEDNSFKFEKETYNVSYTKGGPEFEIVANSPNNENAVTYSIDSLTVNIPGIGEYTVDERDYSRYVSFNQDNNKWKANWMCTITFEASIEANDTHKAAIAECTVNVVYGALNLSFATENPTIMYGDKYNGEANKYYNEPRVKEASYPYNNIENEDVTYTYSIQPKEGSEGCATIDNNGIVTIHKTGTAVVTVTAEVENYTSTENSYTLTINDADQIIEVNDDKPSGKYGEIFFNDEKNLFYNPYTIKDQHGNILENAKVTFSSSDSSVAAVNPNSGVVTIKKAGEVNITLTSTLANYKTTSYTYKLTIERGKQEISFEKGTDIRVTYGEDLANGFLNTASLLYEDEQSTIEYSLVSDENDIVKSVDSSTGEVTFDFTKNTEGTIQVKAETSDESDLYNQCDGTYTIVITNLQIDDLANSYTIKGTKNNEASDWYIGDVTIDPVDEYSISDSNELGQSKWDAELPVDNEAGDRYVTFYLKDADGYISGGIEENVKIDNIAPVVHGIDVMLQTTSQSERMPMNGPLYFGWDVVVTINAEDTLSGVERYFYTLDNGETYTEITGDVKSQFTIEAPFNGIITVYVMDNAGNKSVEFSYESGSDIIVDAVRAKKTVKLEQPIGILTAENKMVENVAERYTEYFNESGATFYYNRKDSVVKLYIEEHFFDSTDVELSMTKDGEDIEIVVDKETGEVSIWYAKDNEETSEDEEKKYVTTWNEVENSETEVALYEISIPLEEDGTYKLKLFYEDKSTNLVDIDRTKETVVLPTIIVDTTAPERSIYLTDPITVADELGNIVEITEDVPYSNYYEAKDYTFYYNGDSDVELTIKEKNFTSDNVVVTVYDESGNPIKDEDLNWRVDAGENENENVLILYLAGVDESSVAYTVKVNAWDRAENSMKEYVSPIIVIDDDPAELSGAVSEPYKADANVNYYGISKKDDTNIKLTIEESNFFSQDVVIKVDDNNDGEYDVYESIVDWNNTSENPDVWSASIPITTEGEYTYIVTYKDRSTNNEQLVCNYTTPKLVVDHQVPTNLNIEYPKVITEKDSVNYYNGTITLKFTADDNISGVDYFDWKYTKTGASSDFAGDVSGKVDIVNGEYVIQLPVEDGQQINGSIDITAHDNSGNTSSLTGSKKIVVDTVAPTRKVTIPSAKQVVDASTLKTKENFDYTAENTNSILYYDGNTKITFDINDANFFAEDVQVKINGTQTTVGNWTTVSEDVYRGSITLSEDGEYIVEILYTDRSGNVMAQYKSDKIVVDKIAPVIKVSYSNSDNKIAEYNGIEYYNANRKATITITDNNFRAENVQAVVTAKDVADADVQVTDYAKYLATRSSWTTKGNVHTAEISYSVDANYTFDIAYTDLALRESANYTKDKFTVDKKNPSGLTVTYSESVLESVLKNVTFGYYNQKVTVTIKAKDETAGINEFVYSYVNSEGVSKVNAELIDKAIKNANIKQDGYEFTASFTIPKDKLTTNNQFNGNVEFTAKDRSANSKSKAEDKRIVVDNIAPEASIKYNEPTMKNGGVSYYSGNINATITINEANFYEEDVNVTITKNGNRLNNVNIDWRSDDTDHHTGTFTLSDDGDYVVSVEYSDRSGNEMSNYKSEQLTIDKVVPTIKVSNIVPNTANKSDTYGFTITVDDKDINISTLNAVLKHVTQNDKGEFVTEDINLDNVVTVANKKTYKVELDNIEEDGIYTLTCSVKDYANNSYSKMVLDDGKEYESVTFSINRNGSVFTVDEGTQAVLDSYYIYELSEDVVIKEINVDPVDTYEVQLNGKTLKEGTDYTTIQTSEDGEWSVRKYVINKTLFEEEGQYNIVVESTDKTGTVTYSDVKSLDVAFVVDKTAPTITITGLSENGRYQTEEQTVIVAVSDDGGKPYSFKVVVYDRNGNPITDDSGNDISVRFDMSGEELDEYLLTNGNKVTFTIPEGIEYDVEIICNDCVQKTDTNQYRQTFQNVTVSPSQVVMFYADKRLFYGSIAGVVILVLLIIFFIIWRKKKKDEEELR